MEDFTVVEDFPRIAWKIFHNKKIFRNKRCLVGRTGCAGSGGRAHAGRPGESGGCRTGRGTGQFQGWLANHRRLLSSSGDDFG
jgi:hypothetical protein